MDTHIHAQRFYYIYFIDCFDYKSEEIKESKLIGIN